MNAGAMGSSMFEVVESVRFMDREGRIQEKLSSQIPIEYRCCSLFKDHIALGAVLRGNRASREAIDERLKRFNAKRWESQPAAPSAGCIFKNPTAIPAGKLIEELGLKGLRIGGAVVSDVHGNFIVNDGAATAGDVLELIATIKGKAKSEREIDLATEVEIVGE
jgi:UDP-N-acetylenolpyruvoylglucosamine reductase